MNSLLKVFKQDKMGVGYLYFYVHFVVEIACFYVLAKVIGNSYLLWMIPLFYDAFAFVPQAIIGIISDKYPKFNMGIIGIILLFSSLLLFELTNLLYISIFLLAIGNAFLHIDGAEATLKCSNGKMSHSAIFVSGGSFGVITGKLLGKYEYSYLIILFLILSIIPFVLLGNLEKRESLNNKKNKIIKYHNEKINPMLVVLLATTVVIVRGYMGYGIPTGWNKTIFQTILLYVFMGTGKALGGIFIDAFGIKKTSILSVLCAIPFLIFGDQNMTISLFGVMLFSMTMAVTLGLLNSVLKGHSGLAFGYTTIGLFLGTVPIFFIKFDSVLINSIIIVVLSILCLLMLKLIIKEEKNG